MNINSINPSFGGTFSINKKDLSTKAQQIDLMQLTDSFAPIPEYEILKAGDTVSFDMPDELDEIFLDTIETDAPDIASYFNKTEGNAINLTI
ncbi:MAG: hypothetical protein PHV68_04580 [Candidatus Gastranaerophilales bacterium]|nr:hypothetical protein [Candidatus Gastranaerophilales bacterium]